MNIRKIIREEVDDFDWVSDIETPTELTEDKVMVGLRVKINPNSAHYGQRRNPYNPMGIWGTVDNFDAFNVYVRWDNGLVNSYEYIDLDMEEGGIRNQTPSIVKENDFEWTEDVPDTTLGELFNNGDLKPGDKVHVMGSTKQGENDIDDVGINTVFTIGEVGNRFKTITVNCDEETKYILGVDDFDNPDEYFSLIEKDADLMVVGHEKSINESNDFDWVDKELPTKLNLKPGMKFANRDETGKPSNSVVVEITSIHGNNVMSNFYIDGKLIMDRYILTKDTIHDLIEKDHWVLISDVV